jgi:hypothetical protein
LRGSEISLVSDRARFLSSLLALLAVGLAFLGPGVQQARAADGELDFVFTQTGGIRLTLPDGTPVGATPIPHGPYQIVVYNDFRDDEGHVHQLRLVGPGVDFQTDMSQGEIEHASWSYTLLPNSTYTWEDEYRPNVLRGTFRTSGVAVGASGSTSGGTSSGGTSTGGSSSGSSSGTSTENTDVVGSGIGPLRGTLAANVSTDGKLTLKFKGKAVSSLKSGRYTVVVLDETAKSAFKLQKSNRQPVTLTGLSFVGRRSKTLRLVPGQWLFYSSPAKKSYFVVIA